MSIAAAIRIDSDEAPWLIARAAEYTKGRSDIWYAISIVPFLPHGVRTDAERDVVLRNLDLATARNGHSIIQEGSNVAKSLLHVAHAFGIGTLLVGPGHQRFLGQTIAEQLLRFHQRRFDVVVLARPV